MLPPTGFMKQKISIPYAGTGAYSTIYRPTTAEQWSYLMGYAPDYTWECQEASGNLASSIGSATLTKNSTGQNYSQTVTDWTTNCVGTDLGSGHGWTSASNIITLHNESVFAFAYVNAVNFDGTTRSLISLRSGNDLEIRSRASDPGMALVCSGSTSNMASDYEGDGLMHPIVLIYDRSASLWRFQSDLQQGTGTYAGFASASRAVGFGQLGANQNAAAMNYNYFAIWRGANAEALADLGGVDGVGGKEFLRRLGWSPP
jgi:hypothetical protein